MKKIRIKIKKEDLRFKPRLILKATKKFPDKKTTYNRKKKHKKKIDSV